MKYWCLVAVNLGVRKNAADCVKYRLAQAKIGNSSNNSCICAFSSYPIIHPLTRNCKRFSEAEKGSKCGFLVKEHLDPNSFYLLDTIHHMGVGGGVVGVS